MTWSRKVRKQARNELQSAATHLYASSSSPCGFLNWNLQTRLSLLNGRIRFSANLLVLICSLITSVITFRSFAWAPALLSEACKGSIPSRYRHGIGTEKSTSKKVSQQSLRPLRGISLISVSMPSGFGTRGDFRCLGVIPYWIGIRVVSLWPFSSLFAFVRHYWPRICSFFSFLLVH